MSINAMKQSGHTTYNNVEFVVDALTDISNLPTTCAPGSIALCIEDSSVYILNGQKEWCKL